jgi:hypothetical protein
MNISKKIEQSANKNYAANQTINKGGVVDTLPRNKKLELQMGWKQWSKISPIAGVPAPNLMSLLGLEHEIRKSLQIRNYLALAASSGAWCLRSSITNTARRA